MPYPAAPRSTQYLPMDHATEHHLKAAHANTYITLPPLRTLEPYSVRPFTLSDCSDLSSTITSATEDPTRLARPSRPSSRALPAPTLAHPARPSASARVPARVPARAPAPLPVAAPAHASASAGASAPRPTTVRLYKQSDPPAQKPSRGRGRTRRQQPKLVGATKKVRSSKSNIPGESRYWTPSEHKLFVEALLKYGSKDLKAISAHVGTRNMIQCRTHEQKCFMRLLRESIRLTSIKNGDDPDAMFDEHGNKIKPQKDVYSVASDCGLSLLAVVSEEMTRSLDS